jgi:hypothetical protein
VQPDKAKNLSDPGTGKTEAFFSFFRFYSHIAPGIRNHAPKGYPAPKVHDTSHIENL